VTAMTMTLVRLGAVSPDNAAKIASNGSLQNIIKCTQKFSESSMLVCVLHNIFLPCICVQKRNTN
jgi:hypothetical protein